MQKCQAQNQTVFKIDEPVTQPPVEWLYLLHCTTWKGAPSLCASSSPSLSSPSNIFPDGTVYVFQRFSLVVLFSSCWTRKYLRNRRAHICSFLVPAFVLIACSWWECWDVSELQWTARLSWTPPPGCQITNHPLVYSATRTNLPINALLTQKSPLQLPSGKQLLGNCMRAAGISGKQSFYILFIILGLHLVMCRIR